MMEFRGSVDLPLFPLHTVLCPGVALPLHIFEDRYKAMVERCLADRSPFGWCSSVRVGRLDREISR